MGNLSNAVQSYLMGRDLGEQRKANRIMGDMLTGSADAQQQHQLAQLNPQQFMQTQQTLQQQQDRQAAEEAARQQAAQQQQIRQTFAAAVSGDDGAMTQLAEVSPTLYEKAVNLMRKRGGEGGMPASVQETIWFNNQSPETQATHLKIKRGEKPTFEEKLDYDKKKEEIKTEADLSKITQKSQADRLQGYVDTGVSSADSLTTINQSLGLMNNVGTGGIDKVLIDAKRLLGIESADEAELSYNLGKTVLSQLKPTFGAAFTKSEVEQLTKLESGLGKSIEGNKRILKSVQKHIETATKRGLRAAERLGLDFEADEIREALEAAQGNKSIFEAPKVEQPVTVNWSDL